MNTFTRILILTPTGLGAWFAFCSSVSADDQAGGLDRRVLPVPDPVYPESTVPAPSAARCKHQRSTRMASQGIHYNNFHTTAVCSSTRAAIKSGRDHHVNNMGEIIETADVGIDLATPVRESRFTGSISRLTVTVH